ncbi:MAG: hypothetical protein ABIP71_00995 [Verrucomicrobiota bacterium]
MNAVTILGIICSFLGVVLHFLAEIFCSSAIQRYLEQHWENPAFFGFSGSGLRDYIKAKKIAKREGHNPKFLQRYERIEMVALPLFIIGILLMLAGEFTKY